MNLEGKGRRGYDVACDNHMTMCTCRGRFGIVYKCIDRQTNQIFAAKHVRIRIKRKAEIRSEVDILKTVAGISPHILELQGAFEKDRVLHIVTEL